MEPPQYEKWLGGSAVPVTQTTAAMGEKLFIQYGCNTCHLPEDESRAPSLQGLFGREVHLQNGETLIADEEYIRESVLNSQARIVEGFFPIMPPYQGHISEEALLQIIAYIKSLRGTPTESENE
jgi:cytochrome c oxidase subunit II